MGLRLSGANTTMQAMHVYFENQQVTANTFFFQN